ncbi:MAG: endolytic transglycosylase MltG [bacterium]
MIGDLLTEEKTLITTFTPKYPFLAGKTSLEGFLMPDTYRISGSTSVEEVVGKMLQNFNKKIYQPFLQSGKPLDAFYDVLTLASIVQEEEKNPTNVPIVAGILKKRLREGMKIGADVTVCYEELIPGGECQKFINAFYATSRESQQLKNYQYDTRNKAGLPPTPIAGVTSDTFFATLNATTDGTALFYLHDKQGIIHTATTDAEHEQNKATYLR